MYWLTTLIFLGVSALCCCIGFKKFVYFLSIGYGFSIIGLGIAYTVFSFINNTWDIIGVLFAILFVIYGIRLSGFLLVREIKNANYRKVLKEATKDGEKKMPFFVKFIIWVTVSVLYFAESCAVFYRSANNLPNSLLRFDNFTTVNWVSLIAPIIGLIISIIGLTLEATADNQKTKQKNENPNMVATKQLYKMVRCPNYFGEILFWCGVFVSGVQSYNYWGQWVMAICGFICIVYVMFDSAKRLDRRQEKRYGEIKEYREYADKTPLIIPFIPLYHLGGKKK